MRSDFGNLLRSSKFSTTTPVVRQCDLKEALTPPTSSYFCLSTALRSLSSLLLILLAACLLGSLAKFRPLWRAMRILRLGILRPANWDREFSSSLPRRAKAPGGAAAKRLKMIAGIIRGITSETSRLDECFGSFATQGLCMMQTNNFLLVYYLCCMLVGSKYCFQKIFFLKEATHIFWYDVGE